MNKHLFSISIIAMLVIFPGPAVQARPFTGCVKGEVGPGNVLWLVNQCGSIVNVAYCLDDPYASTSCSKGRVRTMQLGKKAATLEQVQPSADIRTFICAIPEKPVDINPQAGKYQCR